MISLDLATLSCRLLRVVCKNYEVFVGKNMMQLIPIIKKREKEDFFNEN